MSESESPQVSGAVPDDAPDGSENVVAAADEVVKSDDVVSADDAATPVSAVETEAEAVVEAAPTESVVSIHSASPTTRPTSVPKPSAIKPGPRKPRPAAPAAAATPEAEPVVSVHSPTVIAAAEAFGRVGDDGTVFVREEAGERPVGQVPGQTDSAAMSLYVRRYLDLLGKIELFETRLEAADLSNKEIEQTIEKLAEKTAQPAAVGDLDHLRARVAALKERADAKRAETEARRAAAKAEALEARTLIVVAAEKLAATDPARVQWRTAGDELAKLLEQWKAAQRSGPRIDRGAEDELWKRFSAARTSFDRERRKYFAELDQKNSAAKAAKEALVAEAEKLSDSTDWGATAGAYRDIMARWKAAGRASRKDDDALWNRFRAAQDKFFAARDAANSAVDAEYEKNLAVKEELLVEAEALLPVKDLGATKAKLRTIQEKWEGAGKVPRAAMAKTEARMRAVEQAVRDAEQAQWVRTNPETRARAEGAAAQLGAAIAALGSDITKAQAAGDSKKVAELEAALEARKAWLEQVLRAAEDSRA